MVENYEITNAQVDRLGDQLRTGAIDGDTLRRLDIYRRSFGTAYEEVIGKIRGEVGLEPTGRPAKSTSSIIAKLRRESIRLSQVQDISGARLIVPDIKRQDEVVDKVKSLFEKTIVADRRVKPSHGYRAVHVIVWAGPKFVEIQIRTTFQHKWAETSEKLSDIVDSAIKYGGGDPKLVATLKQTSELVAAIEREEVALREWDDKLRKFRDAIKSEIFPITPESSKFRDEADKKQLQVGALVLNVQTNLRSYKDRLEKIFDEIGAVIPQTKVQ